MSVAKWTWHTYKAKDPLADEKCREREKNRQAIREPMRGRSKQTRAEFCALANRRRQEARVLREQGLSMRAIAKSLQCSPAEIVRLLKTPMTVVVQSSPSTSDIGVVEAAEGEKKGPDEDSACAKNRVRGFFFSSIFSNFKVFRFFKPILLDRAYCAGPVGRSP